MKSHKINKKKVARIAAIQLMYQHEQYADDKNVDILIDKMIEFYNGSQIANDLELANTLPIKLHIKHFTALVFNTINHLLEIDDLIAKHLDKTSIDQVTILLLAILRVAICEMQYIKETPNIVVINEFTNIANDMIADNEIGFVNSILDNISKN